MFGQIIEFLRNIFLYLTGRIERTENNSLKIFFMKLLIFVFMIAIGLYRKHKREMNLRRPINNTAGAITYATRTITNLFGNSVSSSNINSNTSTIPRQTVSLNSRRALLSSITNFDRNSLGSINRENDNNISEDTTEIIDNEDTNTQDNNNNQDSTLNEVNSIDFNNNNNSNGNDNNNDNDSNNNEDEVINDILSLVKDNKSKVNDSQRHDQIPDLADEGQISDLAETNIDISKTELENNPITPQSNKNRLTIQDLTINIHASDIDDENITNKDSSDMDLLSDIEITTIDGNNSNDQHNHNKNDTGNAHQDIIDQIKQSRKDNNTMTNPNLAGTLDSFDLENSDDESMIKRDDEFSPIVDIEVINERRITDIQREMEYIMKLNLDTNNETKGNINDIEDNNNNNMEGKETNFSFKPTNLSLLVASSPKNGSSIAPIFSTNSDIDNPELTVSSPENFVTIDIEGTLETLKKSKKSSKNKKSKKRKLKKNRSTSSISAIISPDSMKEGFFKPKTAAGITLAHSNNNSTSNKKHKKQSKKKSKKVTTNANTINV